MSISAESRTAKIQSIIENRKPIAQKTAKTIEQLNIVRSSLEDFARFLPTVLEKEIPAENKVKINELQNNLKKFDGQILVRLTELNQIKTRFERSTLNIGVAGFPRQGKSTLLQALTGLTSNEIPSAEYNFCTGAPSMIANRAGETTADIEFYTENDFFNEVINPYYRELGLKPEPESFFNFIESPLPVLTPENTGATAKGRYDRLKRIQEQCKGTKLPFGNAVLREIKREQIWNYIAQFDKDKKPLSNWIAVKIAMIYCQFPVQDVGKIVFCDTPGLGEVECGADKNLIKNIADNIDAIMILKRIPPGAVSLIHDTEMYDTIKRAIPELELKKWSHFIINKSNDDKQEGIDNFVKQLEQTHIEVRRYVAIDARNKEEVLIEFDKILNDVAETQKNLDDTLFNKRFENIKPLISYLNEFIEKAKIALPKTVAGVGTPGKFDRMFNDRWKKMGAELVSIDTKYQEKCNAEDVEFVQKLEEIENELLHYDLSSKLNRSDMLGAGITQYFSDKYHELRLDLATAFDQLDKGLDKIIQNVRYEVCGVFLSTDQGGLENIFDVELKNDTKQWLLKLADQIREIDGGERIARIIQYFADIMFSFRGHLLYRIRKNIDPLGRNNDFAVLPQDTFEMAYEKAMLAWEKAVSDCCAALQGLAKEPNRAISAFVEDFCDGILRTGGYDEAKSVWRTFYEQYRADIWPEEYAALDENTKLRDTWNRSIKELGDAVEQLKS
ncbi:MAG: 50S ribosome-binding GTPase [Planctomycetaceae bacterium]|jgi:hypothetical protein|nr:50S ribosome-binding GTPase [Planctomycetaceae bacterium]